MPKGDSRSAGSGRSTRAMRNCSIVPPSIEAIGAALATVPVEQLRLWKAFDPNRHPRRPKGPGGGEFATSNDGAAIPAADRSAADLRAERPHAVHATTAGRIIAAGWQDPKNHAAGLGWRVQVREPDGSRMIYGHLDPTTTPQVGTEVSRGDYIGDYANPTNGHSSGPHVHVQRKDSAGRDVDPGRDSPLRSGRITTPFGQTDRLHMKPHQGVDWKAAP